MGKGEGEAGIWKAWTTLKNTEPKGCENVYRGCGPPVANWNAAVRSRGGPPTRVVFPSFPVASAREAPPREDQGGYAQREHPESPT